MEGLRKIALDQTRYPFAEQLKALSIQSVNMPRVDIIPALSTTQFMEDINPIIDTSKFNNLLYGPGSPFHDTMERVRQDLEDRIDFDAIIDGDELDDIIDTIHQNAEPSEVDEFREQVFAPLVSEVIEKFDERFEKMMDAIETFLDSQYEGLVQASEDLLETEPELALHIKHSTGWKRMRSKFPAVGESKLLLGLVGFAISAVAYGLIESAPEKVGEEIYQYLTVASFVFGVIGALK